MVKGKTFKEVLGHDADSGCSAALEWQSVGMLFKTGEFLGMAVSSASTVTGGGSFLD